MATGNSGQTAICNAVLAELGSTQRITSIHDGSNHANRFREIWPLVVPFAIVLHPWNFAIGRALLNEAGQKPPFGYARMFTLPADCLRWLPPARGDSDYYEAEREGNFLLTDHAAPLPCRYIRMEDDVARWSPGFTWLVKAFLSPIIAEGVTQSEGIAGRMEELAKSLLPQAKRIDGLETGRRRRAPAIAVSSWLRARGHARYPRG